MTFPRMHAQLGNPIRFTYAFWHPVKNTRLVISAYDRDEASEAAAQLFDDWAFCEAPLAPGDIAE